MSQNELNQHYRLVGITGAVVISALAWAVVIRLVIGLKILSFISSVIKNLL